MSLAQSRERRINAGNRMSSMLEKEEDEFYKSSYGGFFEIENDEEFHPEQSDSDEVDSDFDIDENDEPIEEDEEDEDKRKKSRRVITKAYTQPSKTTKPKTPTVKRPKSEQIANKETIDTTKKSIRSSTKLKTEETQLRLRIASEERSKKKPAIKEKVKHYTQEELLKEAKITEQINLRSLENYKKLELEKAKKSKVVKEVVRGPFIRFYSTSMPLIDESQINNNEKLNQDECQEANNNEDDTTEDSLIEEKPKTVGRCSRNFIIFSDEELFNQYFKKNPKPPVAQTPPVCLISNLRARYFDPVTQMPYASSHTFKVLREAYCQQLEHLGDPRQPDVAAWLEWRKKRSEKC